MSRRALHKAFLEHLGRTPGQEIQRARVERAKRLLATTDHKLAVIATMCGYEGSNSFGVAFHRLTSLTPDGYRKSIVA